MCKVFLGLLTRGGSTLQVAVADGGPTREVGMGEETQRYFFALFFFCIIPLVIMNK